MAIIDKELKTIDYEQNIKNEPKMENDMQNHQKITKLKIIHSSSFFFKFGWNRQKQLGFNNIYAFKIIKFFPSFYFIFILYSRIFTGLFVHVK